jgi:hypothetical protein
MRGRPIEKEVPTMRAADRGWGLLAGLRAAFSFLKIEEDTRHAMAAD